MRFPKATEMAHRLVGERLKKRQFAIDATAGNGHDTLFLAEAVGSGGMVYALDVQKDALAASKKLLEKKGAAKQVKLIEASHADLEGAVPEGRHGKISAVMFNLGYLPGGDKSLTTYWESTLPALRQALTMLKSGGLLSVVCYPGHPAGATEANAVARWVTTLDQVDYRALRYSFENVSNSPPFLIAVEKV